MSLEQRLQDAIRAEAWPKVVSLSARLFKASGETDARWAYAAGLGEERRGHTRVARDWMVKACALDDTGPAWDARVRLSLALDDPADALCAYDHAVTLRIATPSDWLFRGRLALAAGALDSALDGLHALAHAKQTLRPAIAKALCADRRGVIPWRLDRVLPAAAVVQGGTASSSAVGVADPAR